MMDYAIRPMEIEDYDLVMELWRESDGIVLSDTDEREPMQRFLRRNPGLSLVAHCRGEAALQPTDAAGAQRSRAAQSVFHSSRRMR